MLRWTVLLSLLALSGCIESDGWLFTRSDLVQPLPAGRYLVEKAQEDGSWTPDGEPGELTVDDGIYRIVNDKVDKANDPGFGIFRLSDRFFGIYMRQKEGGGIYLMLEPKDGSFLMYEPLCSEFSESAAAKAFPPDRIVGQTRCVYQTREKLVGALLAYGEQARPRYRWTLNGTAPASDQQANASRSEETFKEKPPSDSPSTGVKLLTLSVCNKSAKTAWLTLFHRHLFEREKWSLRGWWKLQVGACEPFRIPKGYFYIFAKAEDGSVWQGDDRHICVVDQRVERTIFENEPCLSGEKNRGFRQLFTKDDTYTYNLNP